MLLDDRVLSTELITFIEALEQEFVSHGNEERRKQQIQYMRNQFDFFGLETKERRKLQAPFLDKNHLPDKTELHLLVKTLWGKDQRDFQFFAQELVFKYKKRFEQKDIELFEYMVQHKSWWDTVDFIANKPMGTYFKQFPDCRMKYVNKWLASDDIWLKRSALLFQLKYKEKLDTDLLAYVIQNLLGDKEFFINKAIGWVLRDYSRVNPEWVLSFTDEHDLHPLSRREALRLIQKPKN